MLWHEPVSEVFGFILFRFPLDGLTLIITTIHTPLYRELTVTSQRSHCTWLLVRCTLHCCVEENYLPGLKAVDQLM